MLNLAVSGNIIHGELKTDKILKITKNSHLPRAARFSHCLLLEKLESEVPAGFGAILINSDDAKNLPGANEIIVEIRRELNYLDEGDVIKIKTEGTIRAIFRKRSRGLSLLVTERCNSFCLMCSQPPRDVNDDYLIDDYLKAIPLFDKNCPEIGITGGEPTLLGDRLFALLRQLKCYLPRTSIHLLTNGRTSKDVKLAMRFAELKHPDIMLGIPLYADIAAIHDYVVQADGAFDETILGILNLKRAGVPVEIRVVIHRDTYARLPNLAKFISRNLQFVDHVALMGLELSGFAKSNYKQIHIDPFEYQENLAAAVETLNRSGIRTSIYNHQLCLVPEHVRKFCVKSISDWKNEYLPECSSCKLKTDCGGFFSSSLSRPSPNIKALLA